MPLLRWHRVPSLDAATCCLGSEQGHLDLAVSGVFVVLATVSRYVEDVLAGELEPVRRPRSDSTIAAALFDGNVFRASIFKISARDFDVAAAPNSATPARPL